MGNFLEFKKKDFSVQEKHVIIFSEAFKPCRYTRGGSVICSFF